MGRRIAVACWLTAAGLQAAVTFPALADSEAGIDAPALGDLAWWLGLAVVTVQAALLLRQPAAPRATLLAAAAGAPVAAALGLQAATGVTSVAVLVATFLAVLSELPGRAWRVLAAAAALVALGEVLRQLDTGARLATAVGDGIVQGAGTVGVAVIVGTMVREQSLAGIPGLVDAARRPVRRRRSPCTGGPTAVRRAPRSAHWPSCRRTAPYRKPWPTLPGTPRVHRARSSWTRATRRRSA